MNLGNNLEPPLCGSQDFELWTVDSFQDFFLFFSTWQVQKRQPRSSKDPALKSRPTRSFWIQKCWNSAFQMVYQCLSFYHLFISFILCSSVKLSFKSLDEAPHVAASWAAQTSTDSHGPRIWFCCEKSEAQVDFSNEILLFLLHGDMSDIHRFQEMDVRNLGNITDYIWLLHMITSIKRLLSRSFHRREKKHVQSPNSAFRPTVSTGSNTMTQ